MKLVDDIAGGGDARDKAVEIATELKLKMEHGIDVSGKPSFMPCVMMLFEV